MDDSLMDSFDDGASSDFAPAKPVKAAKPKAAPKAAPKKAAGPAKPRGRPPKDAAAAKPKAKAAPKKKTKPVSDDENSDIDMDDDIIDDDDDDDESLLADTPPKQKKAPAPKKSSGKPLADIENESFDVDGADSPAAKPKKAGGAGSKYQMLTHLEHIMKRPDTYIGSVERTTDKMWVYNSTTESMEHREVNYVPGLYKIFDEILVNAADNKQNDKNMDEIRVKVDRETGVISVRNNGKGIPIEIHKVRESHFGVLFGADRFRNTKCMYQK
jgi:DNA topoisomerase-2